MVAADLRVVGLAVLVGAALAFALAFVPERDDARSRIATLVQQLLIATVAGIVLWVVASRLAGWTLGTEHLLLELPMLAFAVVGAYELVRLQALTRSEQTRHMLHIHGPGISAPILAIYLVFVFIGLLFFAMLNAVLLNHGVAEAASSPDGGRDLFLAAVQTEGVTLLGGIPVLDIPASLRLERDLRYTDVWTGINSMLFKAIVVAPLVVVVKILYDHATAERHLTPEEEAEVQRDIEEATRATARPT